MLLRQRILFHFPVTMGLIDPFSAASKPMPDWDSIPSRPLPFAATLHALDLNAPHPPRLPRPLRNDQEVLPKNFPSPPYSHARQSGQSTHQPLGTDGRLSPTRSLARGEPGSDEWMESMVAACVDNAKGDLVLTCVLLNGPWLTTRGYNLESLSTNIRDLRDLVTLSHKSPSGQGSPWPPRSPLAEPPERQPQLLRLGERPFSRAQSAPASTAFFSRLNGADAETWSSSGSRGPLLPAPRIGNTSSAQHHRQNSSILGAGRRFTRCKTGAVALARTQPNIGVYLSQNSLTRSVPTLRLGHRMFKVTSVFPLRCSKSVTSRSSLFVSTESCLTLTGRKQSVEISPCSDWRPRPLEGVEHQQQSNCMCRSCCSANISQEYLPSTILHLTALEQFRADPNPWLQPPSNGDDAEQGTKRILSPLRSFQEGPVPRLTSLCLTILLSPRPPSNLPPIMSYDWDAHRIGGKHPLLDVEGLHREILPELDVTDLSRIVQAARSGCETITGQRRGSTHLTGRVERFPVSYKVPPPDDASTNMFYSPCPSARHLEWDEESGGEPLPRRVFLHPAEERVEWRDVFGIKSLPVCWLGCSPGCLSFLEDEEDEDEEEDWPVEGFEDEPADEPAW